MNFYVFRAVVVRVSCVLALLVSWSSAVEWTLPTPERARAALLPYPVEVQWGGESVQLDSVGVRFAEGISGRDQRVLAREMKEIFSEVGIEVGGGDGYRLSLVVGEIAGALVPEEAYALKVSPEGAELKAAGVHGFFNGLQTVRQLLTRGERGIECCEVRDWPAFRVRGVMFDVGRNYLSPEFLRQQVEMLSRYKINVVHLHLTEDAAWRLEIRGYPELTNAKAHWKTRQPGKHYSQKEMRDFVQFCQERQIEVIPEIDMPGHSEAFRQATGVSMQSERGVKILQEVLDQVMDIFPSQLVHLGSDEVRVKQRDFMPKMVEWVRRSGREAIVWEPGNCPDKQAIKMHWGDHTGEQMDRTMRHISTVGFYLDWVDAQSGVCQYFFQQPCGVRHGDEKSLGAITCVWTDGALSNEKRVLEQYPFYPCVLTFSERVWRGAHEECSGYFAKLPQAGTAAYRAFAEFEQRLVTQRDREFQSLPFAYVKQSELQWRVIGPFDHHGENDRSFEPEREIKESYMDGERVLQWEPQPAWGSAIHFRHLYSVFNLHKNKVKPEFWPGVLSHRVGGDGGTCYALTYIESPKDQDVMMLFGIGGMWGNSGGYRTARAPEQGQWDFSGGDFWVNEQRVKPPVWPFKSLPWTGWRKGRIEEAPLTEEGYFFRPPVKVHLKKGQNKVLVRVPFGWWKGDRGQRKWFFNCIPVTWDGSHYREVSGLKYAITPHAE